MSAGRDVDGDAGPTRASGEREATASRRERSNERPEPGLVAVFDPFAGISGDMVLGCWVDLGREAGLDRDWLLGLGEALRLPLDDVRVERVLRAGMAAWKVTIVPRGGRPELPSDMGAVTGPAGGHTRDAGVHEHASAQAGNGRMYAEIRGLLEEAELAEQTRRKALACFARLAAAEGRVHGVPAEEVHFHEVGAVDAILDICAAADGWVRLGLAEGRTTPVALGRGTVQIAHGRYPVPAPATAYLLEGTAVRYTGYVGEVVTPTGAALLAEFCRGRAPADDALVRRVGYGAGTRDPEDHPNCLRVWLLWGSDDTGGVFVLQADVDDMSPEYVPDLIEACLEAGALDAVVYGVQMKKGRPGWRLEVQVRAADRDRVEEAVLRHSTSLGIRGWPVVRRVLGRRIEERKWHGHPIRVKIRPPAAADGRPRAKPEHDDVTAAAAAEGLPVAEVLRRLRSAWPDLD